MKTYNILNAVNNVGLKRNSQWLLFDNLEGDTKISVGKKSSKILLKGHLILICTEGSFSYLSASGLHECSAGSLCIMVKDTYCIFKSVSEDCRLCILGSITNAFHLVASSMPNLMLFFRHFREKPTFSLTDHEMQDALSIYRSVKVIGTRKEYKYCTEICQAHDVALFYILLAHVEHIEKSTMSSRQGTIYNRFLTDAAQNFRHERRIEYYASLQCLTEKRLYTIVKQESGLTPHQWICDFVMIEARDLLADKTKTVQEIAELLHFSDQSAFGKFFKIHEGLSPLQYRKQPDKVVEES